MRKFILVITISLLVSGCAGAGEIVDLAVCVSCQQELEEVSESLSRARIDRDECLAQLDAAECPELEPCPPAETCPELPECPEPPEPPECPSEACEGEVAYWMNAYQECEDGKTFLQEDLLACQNEAGPSDLDRAMERYNSWRAFHDTPRCSMWAHTNADGWRVAVNEGDTAVGKAATFVEALNKALDDAIRAGCRQP